MISVTREELRSDIEEIVERIVVREKKSLIRMINEDIFATNRRIDKLDRKFTKKFKNLDERVDSIETKLDETNALLKAHILNPSTHNI